MQFRKISNEVDTLSLWGHNPDKDAIIYTDNRYVIDTVMDTIIDTIIK